MNVQRFLSEQFEIDAMRDAVAVGDARPIRAVRYTGFVVHKAPPDGPVTVAIGHIDGQGKIIIDFVDRYATAGDAIADLRTFGISAVAGAVISNDFYLDGTAIAIGSLIVALRRSKLH